MKNQVLLSIITPSYNRANLLPACYQSLYAQTDKDFEWIIVDDGSSDNTEQVVQSFSCTDFPVIYVKKENGGKHTALNAAHPYIHGEYVLILDSDDTLIETAVADILQNWSRYDKQKEVGVLTFLRSTPDGQIFASVKDYDTPVDILSYPRIVYLGNDCCEVIRTELFKQYPFPVFPGERFLAEGVLWYNIGSNYQCVYIDKAIYICEYLEDGLTRAGRRLRIRNPKGSMFNAQMAMNEKAALTQRIKNGLLYCCYGFFAGLSATKIMSGTTYKLLTAVCLLPGYGLYIYWKKKYG